MNVTQSVHLAARLRPLLDSEWRKLGKQRPQTAVDEIDELKMLLALLRSQRNASALGRDDKEGLI